jgi:hypothetical protein
MKRTTSKVSIGGGLCRVSVRIESFPCEIDSREARRAQVELLRSLTDNIELLNCGFSPFQKLSMKHNGEVWTVEMEAVQPE